MVGRGWHRLIVVASVITGIISGFWFEEFYLFDFKFSGEIYNISRPGRILLAGLTGIALHFLVIYSLVGIALWIHAGFKQDKMDPPSRDLNPPPLLLKALKVIGIVAVAAVALVFSAYVKGLLSSSNHIGLDRTAKKTEILRKLAAELNRDLPNDLGSARIDSLSVLPGPYLIYYYTIYDDYLELFPFDDAMIQGLKGQACYELHSVLEVNCSVIYRYNKQNGQYFNEFIITPSDCIGN